MRLLSALMAMLLFTALSSAFAAVTGTPELRSGLIDRFLQQRVGTVPQHEATGETREFTLEIHKIRTEIAPGVHVEQWAFSFPGEKPSVPGPELRVRQGDRVRVTLVNTHEQPHSVHLHGITALAQEMDGVPHTSREVLPGQSFTYEFVAIEAGTFAYHCHVQTNLHLDMGMYGALIVEPPKDSPALHHAEEVLILDEWDTRQNPNALKHVPTPNFFLVNGKAHPAIPDVQLNPGQVGLLRLIHMGSLPHSLHLHGNNFLIIAKDGYDLAFPVKADTLPILPGERYDLLIRGRDGTFPFHDHMLQHNLNDGVYPGGMHLLIRGSPALTATGAPGTITGPAHDHRQAPAIAPTPSGAQLPPAAPIAAPASEASERPASGTPDAPEVRATLSMFGNNPFEVRVKRGTTVTFVNADRVGHTVTSGPPGGDPSARAFDSSGEAQGRQEVIYPGASWSFTFQQAGAFEYHCIPHPAVRGRVIVEE